MKYTKHILLLIFAAAVMAATPADSTEDHILQLLDNARITEARRAIESSRVNGTTLLRLRGYLYYAEYKADSALLFLQDAYEAGDRTPRTLLRLAEVRIWRKENPSAFTLLKQVKADTLQDPRSWSYLERKATLLSWMGKLDEAEKIYTRILDSKIPVSSFKARCRVHRAEVYAWKKEFVTALSELDIILKAEPGHIEASLLRGQILEWQGKYPEAKAAYSAALQLHPDDAQLRTQIEKLGWAK